MNLVGLAGNDPERMRELEERQAAQLGTSHPDVLLTRFNRGVALADSGQHDEAG